MRVLIEHETSVGKAFGRWTVQALVPGKRMRYRCSCACGNTTRDVDAYSVLSGASRGCRACSEHMGSLIHGDTANRAATTEFKIWCGMRERCSNPNADAYPEYGGRGIKVCEAWLGSFEAFLADMGRRPSPRHSLDRYPNGDGNYEPGNVRWATHEEQARNRKSTRWLTHDGVTLCAQDWAERLGIPAATIYDRLRRKLPTAEVLSTKKGRAA